MDTAVVENLKHQLMSVNPEFRELINEHGKYESRLSELSMLPYPNEDEQWEEVTLKKKKLALKDQIYDLMAEYQKSQTVAH
jgi:uncharacterized protein YdcH (DUF465 family)